MSVLMSTSDIEALYPLTASEPAKWPASLELQFIGGPSGTQLFRKKHRGPLYVQRPFYPEGKHLAHIYLLHPPGGVVSGDTLNIAIKLDQAAKVLVTSPGATRLYRARLDEGCSTALPQKITTTIDVSDGSYIEWLPCETLVYDGAQIELCTKIALQGTASMVAWEITCLGLPASSAPFMRGRCFQRFEIYLDGEPKFIEPVLFNAGSPMTQSLSGFQSQPVFATLAAGPSFSSPLDDIVEVLRNQLPKPAADNMFAVTQYDGFIVVRYLGACTEYAKNLFIQCWTLLRPFLVNHEPVLPRIWAT